MAKRAATSGSNGSLSNGSGTRGEGSKGAGRKNAGSGSAGPGPTDRLIETAMSLAAERSWRDLSLAEIAEGAGLSLGEAYAVFPSKSAILRAFSRKIDAEVLGDASLSDDWDAGETTARDRLFDVMMRRFDALAPYRPGLANVIYDQAREPLGALWSLRQVRRSMAAMLEAARLSPEGLAGEVRVRGLVALYLATLRVWLRDESADMAKTMASLDGYLRRIEAGLQSLSGRRRRGAGRPED